MPFVCSRCGKNPYTRAGLRCPACIENYARSADDSAADAAFIASVTGGPSYAPAANDATAAPAMDSWMLERFAATVDVRVLGAGTPPVVTCTSAPMASWDTSPTRAKRFRPPSRR
jgi:hypothetical protein